MKIICWNLNQLDPDKLNNTLAPGLAALCLGSTLLEYVTKVVSGDPVWNNINNNNSADIFVIIDMVSGGKTKGTFASGACQRTIPKLVNALNLATNTSYNYAPIVEPVPVTTQGAVAQSADQYIVQPRVIGRHECVGIIYNTNALTYVSSKVLTNNDGFHLTPRTPYLAEFTVKPSGETLKIVSVHSAERGNDPATELSPGVPSSPCPDKPPVDYSNQLGTIAEVNQDGVLVMGDFNCNAGTSYNNGAAIVHSFSNFNLTAGLTSQNLTTVKPELDDTLVAPATYLDKAYDNIYYKGAYITSPTTKVLDLLGNARNMMNASTPVTLTPDQLSFMVAEYYNKFSDHLPVQIEFTIGTSPS